MEKKEKISKSKKDTCVIDLTTTDDKHVQASTNSCILQTKKRKIYKNEASVQLCVKEIEYKRKYTTLQDVIKKVKINTISMPVSEITQKADNTVIIIDSSTNNINVEDPVSRKSIKENAKNEIISVIPALNLHVKNTILHSKCNTDKKEINPVNQTINLDDENITVLHSKCNTDKKEITSTTPIINVDLEDITALNSKCNTDKKEITSTTPIRNVDLEDIIVLNSKCNIDKKEITSTTPIINMDLEDIIVLNSKCNTGKKEINSVTQTTNLHGEDISVLHSKCNTDKKEITLTTNNSEKKDKSSVTQTINLNVEDINVLHSYETNLCTSYEQIIDNIDILNEDFSQYFKEPFDISFQESSKEVEERLSNTMDMKDSQNKCQPILKNSNISKQDFVPSNQLNTTKLEAQLDKIKVFSNDIDISLPITKNSNGETISRFYWWDAYEDTYKQQGIVYLFGKVYIDSIKTCYSCCLSIKNLPRRIYLLPTKHFIDSFDANLRLTTMEDVYNEFNELANKLGIKEFQSRRVWKKYVFKEGVQNYTEYLEILYPAMYPAIDSNYSGFAIEKILETTITPLQLLLLEKNIKGPCWLDIKHPTKDLSDTIWCKVKLICTNIKNISVSVDSPKLSLPPMVIAALNVCTCPDPKTKQNQILMVVIILQDECQIIKDVPKPSFKQTFCLITKPNDTLWPHETDQQLSNISNTNIIKCENESVLLEELLRIIEEADPDLYVGYDCSYQFESLLHRMFILNIGNWSKLGKVKHFTYPVTRQKTFINRALSGRPVCDIKIIAKELNIKSRSYDLQSLCTTVLNKKSNESKEIKSEDYFLYYTTKKRLEDLIKLTLADTLDILSVTFKLNMIPFAIELTCISGTILSKILAGSQMERNEFLLLHAFHANDYILPDSSKLNKNIESEISGKKISTHKGGLVLTPIKGFYTTLILLMDYISLYPSIIIEYNLCFSTIPGAAYTDYKDLKMPELNSELGVIPKEIQRLTEYRKQVKKLITLPDISPSQKMQYNAKQIALKLMANSIYGCLGAPHCRFYAKGLAALITSKGREILLNTKHLIENMKYEIIYGDTDSIMIKTNLLEYNEVISIGDKIKGEINKSYRNIVLDIDTVFQYLLLFQKKKYAALAMKKLPNGRIELSQIHKGIETIRKDWCPLSVEVGKNILNNIFSNQPHDMKIKAIYEILQNISRTIRENQISLSSFIISKQLSKNLNNYHDEEQPHIQVATRLYKRYGKLWKAGDTISYVICQSETDKSITNKSYHINELKENKSLKIDINYYLKKQILPIALRICEPIAEVDKILLAKNLGLDNAHGYKGIVCTLNNIEKQIMITADRFKHCKALTFRCINENCRNEITIKDVTSESSNGYQLFLNTICSNNTCKIPLWKNVNAISNELVLNIRQAINMYYSNELKCKNPLCSNVTKRLPMYFYTMYPKCDKCNESFICRKYTETDLYDQICFYHKIFDISHLQNKLSLVDYPEEIISVYNTLKDIVNKYLKCTSYLIVNFDKVFQNKFIKYTVHDSDYDISSNDYAHMDSKQL
uniref:DNA polymerase alpha catalytic subunit-like isoform X2 n=1 Tax=Vespula vulgaris TaxID=7454 RepID=UPI00223AC991|nr:DNA polymerase alpha catalytic subunit-like isoform X2 [Vespula vulgaris]